MIPKKKYRDKVRERLQTVKQLFADRERTEKMLKQYQLVGKGSDVHNKFYALFQLLNVDIPALLDAFDNVTSKVEAD